MSRAKTSKSSSLKQILDLRETAKPAAEPPREQTERERADGFLQKAIEMLGKWDLDKASDALMKGLEIDPGHDPSYIQLGYLHLKRGQFEEARKFFLMAQEIHCGVEALVGTGYYFYEQGHFAEAAEEFKKALAIEPENANAHLALGKALTRLGRPMEGFVEFEKARKAEPWCVEHVFAERGDAFRRHGLFEDAAREFEQALEANMHSSLARLSLAECLEMLDRRKEALFHYRIFTLTSGDREKIKEIQLRIEPLGTDPVNAPA